MTMLFELVETSRRVAATPSRKAKVAELTALLRKLDDDEIATAVAFLSGETPQGRSGVGYALLRDARPDASPVEAPQLSIGEVDAALTALAAATGSGSKVARTRKLQALLARATDASGAVQPVEQPWNVQGMANNMTQRVTVVVTPSSAVN